MSLSVLRQSADKKKINNAPNWVTNKNATYAAHACINEFKDERLSYINTHKKVSDYKRKGTYQITASEVARKIEVATTTLISTSSYSDELKKYLLNVNLELKNTKIRVIETHIRTRSGGLKQKKKDELRIKLQEANKELAAIKQKNAHEQVTLLLAELPLPLKQKLGLNV